MFLLRVNIYIIVFGDLKYIYFRVGIVFIWGWEIVFKYGWGKYLFRDMYNIYLGEGNGDYAGICVLFRRFVLEYGR